MSETTSIVTPAVELLNKMPGVWAMRVNSGGRKVGRNFIHFAPKGTADIFCVADGQAFFFEAKLPGERLTEAQQKFAEVARKAGAAYFVVTSRIEPLREIERFRELRESARRASLKMANVGAIEKAMVQR